MNTTQMIKELISRLKDGSYGRNKEAFDALWFALFEARKEG